MVMSCMSSSSMLVQVPFRAGLYAIWREVRTPLASSSVKGIQNTLADLLLIRTTFKRVGTSGTARIKTYVNSMYETDQYLPPCSVNVIFLIGSPSPAAVEALTLTV